MLVRRGKDAWRDRSRWMKRWSCRKRRVLFSGLSFLLRVIGSLIDKCELEGLSVCVSIYAYTHTSTHTVSQTQIQRILLSLNPGVSQSHWWYFCICDVISRVMVPGLAALRIFLHRLSSELACKTVPACFSSSVVCLPVQPSGTPSATQTSIITTYVFYRDVPALTNAW